MKISLNWLSDYVTLPPHEELVRRLTMAGLEVEGVELLGEGLDGVVVAQVLDSQKHPNADKLSVTRIDAGLGQPLQVVCGAKNYKIGDKVPLATVGAKLPGGGEIKQAQLRGVDSFGMLCSARELGLSQDASGLLILPAELTVGTPIAQALSLKDKVLEVNVTPNRSDALSHLGIAREVTVLTGAAMKPPSPTLTESKVKASDKVKIRIDNAERCPRYAARVVEGVKLGPSPAWLARRLEACGVRAISNVVDVTNYVLLEYGQPLHAFDFDKVAGAQIVVRLAKPKERMVTLDGKERALDVDDLLICDRDRPQVLAGVMGGADSEVSDKTTNVLLEAAHFQPASVRRSSKRHALHSESSHRFERGTDVDILPAVLDRAAALLAELAGGTVLEGRVDVYPTPKQKRAVALRDARVGQVLGLEIPTETTHRILEALGFAIAGAVEGGKTWAVPMWRVDVEREEDLIEEVARVNGYDAIPVRLPRSAGELLPEPPRMEAERRVRQALAGGGFDEVINYSFVSRKEIEALGHGDTIIAVQNPLSEEQGVMRTTLLAGLLQNVSRNARHQAAQVRLYEMGRVFAFDSEGGKADRPPAQERHHVGGVLWGSRGARSWTAKDAAVDFYDAKGAVEEVLSALHLSATFEAAKVPQLHPRATATVKIKGRAIGTVGELHPRVAKRLDLPAGIFAFELDADALVDLAALVPQHQALPKHPAVLRDLALVVDASLESEAVRRLILEVGAPLVEEASVFDVYTGKPIPEGKKNLAYALKYQAKDRTLTDAEVSQAHQKIVEQVNRRLGGNLRV